MLQKYQSNYLSGKDKHGLLKALHAIWDNQGLQALKILLHNTAVYQNSTIPASLRQELLRFETLADRAAVLLTAKSKDLDGNLIEYDDDMIQICRVCLASVFTITKQQAASATAAATAAGMNNDVNSTDATSNNTNTNPLSVWLVGNALQQICSSSSST